MKKNEYYKKLKDPRWQKKRLEIFTRDGFCCQICGDTETTLNVHHMIYSDCDPWDIDNEYLVTLCENCHETEYQNKNKHADYMKKEFSKKFHSYHLYRIGFALTFFLSRNESAETLASSIEYMLACPKMHEIMIKEMRKNEKRFENPKKEG